MSKTVIDSSCVIETARSTPHASTLTPNISRLNLIAIPVNNLILISYLQLLKAVSS